MAMLTVQSSQVETTINLGLSLAAYLKAGDIICLTGELGSGKTTLVKGLYLGLGGSYPELVKSPTFTLINEYPARLPVYHFDFYRLKSFAELAELGIEEYLYGAGVSLIEWGNRFPEILGKEYLDIKLSWQAENNREITLNSNGSRFQTVLAELKICYSSFS